MLCQHIPYAKTQCQPLLPQAVSCKLNGAAAELCPRAMQDPPNNTSTHLSPNSTTRGRTRPGSCGQLALLTGRGTPAAVAADTDSSVAVAAAAEDAEELDPTAAAAEQLVRRGSVSFQY